MTRRSLTSHGFTLQSYEIILNFKRNWKNIFDFQNIRILLSFSASLPSELFLDELDDVGREEPQHTAFVIQLQRYKIKMQNPNNSAKNFMMPSTFVQARPNGRLRSA